MKGQPGPEGLNTEEVRTDAEAALIREHDLRASAGGIARPGVEFAVAARGPEGDIVGGVSCSTELSVMWLEVLWVSERRTPAGGGAGKGRAVSAGPARGLRAA